ncbi:6-phosphofructokinase [Papillibacter cinnamivorans]|uniref:Pyrophosphate--fructose 6-phosphate 1-phosphotransferase n=1 Tax=Papillibacter cinnamivorans DSM 12816 TaxID=1122930 RepID=A0A1W1ZQH5_9FIRM|nr:6-phosphofructokinase [Papillibacter cinnamivorans]SMC50321.1 6-phosphofructokinase 1 [Papillibacter cinnamivorans DSM 12816]
MKELKGACIIGQSGGPTSVINASALGAIRTALDSGTITRVLGAAHGIRGVLDDRLYDMGKEDPAELELLRYTPSSALGSVRYKMKDPDKDPKDYERILEIFRKYDVRYFFYNGGNDSMDTCNKISKFMRRSGHECRVIGIPKTIDNDLYGTDHCPGYGSAAKFIATTCMEVYQDARVYDTGMITVIEIMGRNAGWLAAAASLACLKGAGPDLVYLPELPFSLERFYIDVEEIYRRTGKVIIGVSEGIRDEKGTYISEYGSAMAQQKDAFGHAQMGGLATTLASLLQERTGAKVRGIELSLLQRCAAHLASLTDIREAYLAGQAAVEAAIGGETDKMVAFRRDTGTRGEYLCRTELIDLHQVANLEKKVPREWINEAGNGMKQEFIDYALPLIQGEPHLPKEDSLPRFARLKKVLTSEV